MRRLILLALACLAATIAHAEDGYPRQRVLMIVPFAPGGPADTIARILSEPLAERLGQPVIIENRPGGGGSAGVTAVARATPDGYTVLLAGDGPLSIVPALAKPPYDALAGLSAISVFAVGGCTVLAVNPAVPASDLPSFIAYAKAASPRLTFASAGLGTPSDTVAAELMHATGVTLERVIYRGAAPAMSDVIAGHVPVMFATGGAAADQIATGKLRAIAVTTRARCKVLPDVPSAAEKGIDLDAGRTWFGLFAPSATSAAITDRLHANLTAIASTPEFAKRIAVNTMEPATQPDRAAAEAIVRKDAASWADKAERIPGLR